MDKLWYLWFILAVIFIIAELFTSGFVLLWFGVGAIAAGVLALAGFVGLPVQVAVFLTVAVVLTIASRTIFERFLLPQSPGRDLKIGVEALIGREAVVVEKSSGATKEAAVRLSGATWRAFPILDDTVLNKGDKVIVERVEGASVYVRIVEKEPSWRSPKQLSE